VIAKGDRDPFIAIAAVVGAVYSLFIAGLVGLAFAQIRSWRLVRRRQTSA
jgi:hypothetical protein